MENEEKTEAQAIVESTPHGYVVLARGWYFGKPEHFVPIANFGECVKEAIDFRDDIRHGAVRNMLLTRRWTRRFRISSMPNERYTADESGRKQLQWANRAEMEIDFKPNIED